METEYISLFSSDVLKVLLGAFIGLAGTLIVATMTYRLEMKKMKANHRASIVKESQLIAHQYFSRIKGLLIAIESKNKGEGNYKQSNLDEIFSQIFEYQAKAHLSCSQLKSIGLHDLAESLSNCTTPFGKFCTAFQKGTNDLKITAVASEMNSLEDNFLADVCKTYGKLSL